MTTPAPLMAEELMIGNYVTDEFYDSFKTIYTVESINDKGINLEIDNDGQYPECATYFIEPEFTFDKLRGIPLTEQWLKEFGFNSKGLIDGWYEKNILHEWVYILYNHQHGLCELIVSKHSMIPKNIKYVHQLQNLYFALTATKLERGGV